MEEDSQGLQFETLAAALRADHGVTGDLLEHMAHMLETSYPGGTTISRTGWILSKTKPVQELNVRFDDWQFQIVRQKHGSTTARAMKLVRGVALKTTELPVEKCIEEILKELVKLSDRNAQARSALDKFVSG